MAGPKRIQTLQEALEQLLYFDWGDPDLGAARSSPNYRHRNSLTWGKRGGPKKPKKEADDA